MRTHYKYLLLIYAYVHKKKLTSPDTPRILKDVLAISYFLESKTDNISSLKGVLLSK